MLLLLHRLTVIIFRQKLANRRLFSCKRLLNQCKTDHFLAKCAQETPMISVVFYQSFSVKFAPKSFSKFPVKSATFAANMLLKVPRNLAFFRDLPEPLCLAGVLVGRGKKPDVAGLSEAYEFPRLSKLTS